MAIRSETIQVSGIRCERCVLRLGGALRSLEGLESANATLTGQLTFAWDERRIRREQILEALEQAGFKPA